MAKVDLLPNEAIIMRDSQMKHDRGGKFDSTSDELLLTNLALLVVHKSRWGSVKDVVRFPLEQIKVVNGVPQVIVGLSSEGERQLHVHFYHGIEAFTLGEADDDGENFFDALFTPTKEKEKRNLNEWREAILCALSGTSFERESSSDQKSGPLGAIMGVVAAGAERVTNTAASFSGGNKPTTPVNKTSKCIGCRAPLSGKEGQKITCKYCDTEQVI